MEEKKRRGKDRDEGKRGNNVCSGERLEEREGRKKGW